MEKILEMKGKINTQHTMMLKKIELMRKRNAIKE